MFSVLHAEKEESLVKFIIYHVCDVGVEAPRSMARANHDSALFDGS